MNQRISSMLLIGLIMIQILSGCTWFSEEEEYREGFDESDFVKPYVPTHPPHPIIDRPDDNESQLPPGFSYNLSWAMGDVYALWGGFIRINVENSGLNDIFVYRYGIVMNWSLPSEQIYEERNVLLQVGEEKQLGLVYFSAPNTTGNYSYHIIISLLVMDNELFERYNVESWYDNGTVHSKERILNVTQLNVVEDGKITHNYKHYYDKLNERVDFDDGEVQSIVAAITNRYPGDYNIYQVLAAFEFILNNLSYISDPEGRDEWLYPYETLVRRGGDCEDFSILFSSMIGAMGGTTRAYLTQTHAFSVLYIGNASEKNEILGVIEVYYGTEPNFVVFEEEGSYWLTADPAGALYLGGLPADSEPALALENPLSFGWNFFDTKEVHVIDILG